MKKILFTIIAVLALAACIKEDVIPAAVESENIELDFSVVVPEAQTATKTLAEPAIANLTVLVFDENGMLLTARTALPKTSWGVSATEPTAFTVTLPQYQSACNLHFVANCPRTFAENETGSEAEIMTSLVTTNNADAYWQRVSVPNLLAANQTMKDKLVADYFTNIPLIRNFAKITVQLSDEVSDFTLDGYTLINEPTSGTVVPYNTTEGRFEAYNIGGVGLDYFALKGLNYSGFLPSGVEYEATVPEQITNKAPIYTYESKSGTTLIIAGTYKNTKGYYKVDLVSPENNYNNGNFEILRNLHYIVTISSVIGSGYETAAAAAEKPAGNNIGASSDTQSLLNISDGKSRIFVDATAKYIVSSENTFTIKYRYEPEINGDPANDDVIYTRSKSTETADAVISSWERAEEDENGWRTITITPKDLPSDLGSEYTEEVIIKKGSLSRTVKLYLRNPYIMDVSCDKTSASTLKTEVTVSVTIPDKLPKEIFPLVFDMEDDKLCLSPNATRSADQGALPVTSGPSIIFPGENTFHYKRTLTRAQYDALAVVDGERTFKTYFLTNKASVSEFTVHVKHELFRRRTQQ